MKIRTQISVKLIVNVILMKYYKWICNKNTLRSSYSDYFIWS